MLGDTDAGVAHVDGEVEHVALVVAHVHPHANAAGLGEFHRVGDQVAEDLAQPGGVGADLQAGQRLRALHVQVQALLPGQVAEGAHTVLQQRFRGEVALVDLHAPGFDARKVENVVDHRQQVAGGFQGGVGVFALLVVLVGGFQQLQHAQHAVHGGAQLVAHHRQEVALGLAGVFGAVVRLAQLGHDPLLVAAGLVQAGGQFVDVGLQMAQLAAERAHPAHVVVAATDHPHQAGQIADRVGDLARQITGAEQPHHHGQQRRQQAGADDLFLAGEDAPPGHAQHHLADAVRARRAAVAEGRVQGHRLAVDAGVEFQHVLAHHPVGLQAGAQQRLAVLVAELHVLHVRARQHHVGLAAQVGEVAAEHTVFGTAGELLGEEAAQLAHFVVGVLKALPGERYQHQDQHDQRRDHPQPLQLPANAAATCHGVASKIRSRGARSTGLRS